MTCEMMFDRVLRLAREHNWCVFGTRESEVIFIADKEPLDDGGCPQLLALLRCEGGWRRLKLYRGIIICEHPFRRERTEEAARLLGIEG